MNARIDILLLLCSFAGGACLYYWFPSRREVAASVMSVSVALLLREVIVPEPKPDPVYPVPQLSDESYERLVRESMLTQLTPRRNEISDGL